MVGGTWAVGLPQSATKPIYSHLLIMWLAGLMQAPLQEWCVTPMRGVKKYGESGKSLQFLKCQQPTFRKLITGRESRPVSCAWGLARVLAGWLAGWLAGLLACLLACLCACVLVCLPPGEGWGSTPTFAAGPIIPGLVGGLRVHQTALSHSPS